MKTKQSFLQEVSQALRAGISPQQPSKVLLALSGGPDSTALLSALVELRGELLIEVIACHLNYGLRGEASDEDARFCREFCASLAVPLTTYSVTSADTSEATLRTVRYDRLDELAQASGVQCILTAHTLDDQIETMLFRMFRGTAVGGLAAIPFKRNSHSGIPIVRPMLRVPRVEVEHYLLSRNIEARLDATNLESNYARNYIRNEVVPIVVAKFPGFAARMENLRIVIQAEDAYLNKMLDDLCQSTPPEEILSVRFLGQCDQAITRRLLAREMHARDIEVDFQRIETLLNFLQSGEGVVSLNQRWDACVNKRALEFIDKEKSFQRKDESGAWHSVRIPGKTMALNLAHAFSVEEVEADSLSESKYPQSNSWEALVDLSKCATPLVLRVRHAGDVITPFGMNESVRLKKFLHTHERTEAALSPGGNTIILADDREVLWVPGVGLSEKLRVTTFPTHALRLIKLAEDGVKLS